MLKDMDSPNTSLKQGRLPFKMLDAKSDFGRKRKLVVADDSHNIAKSMKCAHKIPSDDCVAVSISCKEESEIENIPSVTSSPKTTERIRKVSQNCLNESKLSPTKQKSVKVKEAQIVEESAEIGTREKQVKESSQEKGEVIEITSDIETETTENPQKLDDCGNSVDHPGILTALDKSIMDKSSELNSSSVVTNNSLRTCFCSEDKFGGFAGASSSTAEKDKQEDTQEAPCEKQINRKHHVKKPVMAAKKVKLTQEKMKARAKRKAEREMERERRKKLKQEIKENKERAKAMKDKEKQERKEREEKERLEKRQQKQLLLDSKLEEKRRKEEEKQRKLDEKRKAEEERQRKLDEKRKAEEEEERKKEKAKAAFVSFFVKPAPTSLQQVDQQQHGLFRPFEVMKDMKLAPCVPVVAVENFNKERFEKLLSFQGEQQLYLEEMQNDKHKPYLYSKMNLRNEETDDDVILLDDDVNNGKEKLRPKLLQFCENIRPPYWGTWRKKSKMVCGRQPLKKDEVYFDYDVESDEEWDEGGPGESLSGTEDEKESDDDYEVDNEFLVPHGYLSNDEEDEDENSAVTPETKHALLKMREREFNDERSKKYSELKPNVIGCFQGNGIISFTEELRKSLEVYSIVALTTIPVITTDMLSKVSDDVQSNYKPEKHVKAKKSFPEEAMPHFIKLVHGNTNGHQSVIREFREFWQNYCKQSLPKQSVITLKEEDSERTASFSRLCGNDQDVIDSLSSPSVAGSGINEISKRQLKIALHDIAEWCRGKIGANKYCWWVHEEIRERYHLIDLPIPNCWHYVSMKNNIEKSHISIKKFAKVIT